MANMVLPQSLEVVSGFAEAEQHEYRMNKGKSGRAWFYAVNLDNSGDYIYCTDSANWDQPGQGFGGATIELQLDNGKRFSLRGGWHSNDEALLEDTGVDLRQLHRTFVIISRGREDGMMVDVVYHDEQPKVGYFNRGERLALEMARSMKEPLYYFARSAGGSISAKVYP